MNSTDIGFFLTTFGVGSSTGGDAFSPAGFRRTLPGGPKDTKEKSSGFGPGLTGGSISRTEGSGGGE
jgi:hypothetical protein